MHFILSMKPALYYADIAFCYSYDTIISLTQYDFVLHKLYINSELMYTQSAMCGTVMLCTHVHEGLEPYSTF